MKKSTCLYNARASSQVDSKDVFCFFSDSLEQHIDKFGSVPDAIYITSSIELAIFAFDQINDALIPLLSSIADTEVKIVSQGCLGVYAGIMSFNQDDSHNSVLMLSIEAPEKFIQDGLNAAGIGTLPGQDGLQISPSIGSISLYKKSSTNIMDDDLVIDSCEIISVPTSLSKQAFSIVKMTKNLIALLDQSYGRLVSFEVSAPWSKAIFRVIKSMVIKKFPEAVWLDSVEQDHKHYMTVKQILELVKYQAEIESRPLIMTGLGVGGRFGILRIASAQYAHENTIPTPSTVSIDFQDNVTFVRGIIHNPVGNQDKVIKDNILSYDKRYRGLDNQIFCWDLDLHTCNGFLPEPSLEQV